MERKEALGEMVNSTELKLGDVCKEIMKLRGKPGGPAKEYVEFEKQLWELKNRLRDAADVGRTMIMEYEAGGTGSKPKPLPTPPPSEGMSPKDSR